jgi:hypothetical protein
MPGRKAVGMDGWEGKFNFSRWLEAFAEANIDPLLLCRKGNPL